MRIGSIVLVLWLVVGVFAAYQRHYFESNGSCSKAGTVIVTIVAGPLNYVGVNPKVKHCSVPQPSK